MVPRNSNCILIYMVPGRFLCVYLRWPPVTTRCTLLAEPAWTATPLATTRSRTSRWQRHTSHETVAFQSTATPPAEPPPTSSSGACGRGRSPPSPRHSAVIRMPSRGSFMNEPAKRQNQGFQERGRGKALPESRQMTGTGDGGQGHAQGQDTGAGTGDMGQGTGDGNNNGNGDQGHGT